MRKLSRLRSIMTLLGPRLRANEQGRTAIEYALIAAGVSAVIAATVFSFGADLKTTFYDRIAALL